MQGMKGGVKDCLSGLSDWLIFTEIGNTRRDAGVLGPGGCLPFVQCGL